SYNDLDKLRTALKWLKISSMSQFDIYGIQAHRIASSMLALNSKDDSKSCISSNIAESVNISMSYQETGHATMKQLRRANTLTSTADVLANFEQ
ncbi:MAG: hypothetical protein MHPSP_003091, partial [Paramarteilia canceri]